MHRMPRRTDDASAAPRRPRRSISWIAVLSLLLVALAPTPAHAQDELVANPSFETFGDSGPTDWGTWNPAGEVGFTQVEGRDGSSAAQIRTESTDGRGFLVQDVAVPADAEHLEISFWQEKSEMVGTGRAAVRVTFPGHEAQFLGEDDADSWRQVRTVLDVPEGATELRIEPMVDYLQGEMRLDDVSATVSDGAIDHVVNGGLEAFDAELPDAWRSWNPAGTGGIERVAGRTGEHAVQITTDTDSSRLALVQDVELPAAGPMSCPSTWTSRRSPARGRTGIRADVVDGSGGSTFLGRSTPTDGWERTGGVITVPEDATTLRLHVPNLREQNS